MTYVHGRRSTIVDQPWPHDASRRAGSAGISALLAEFYMAKGRHLRPKARPGVAHRCPTCHTPTKKTKEVLPMNAIELDLELLRADEVAKALSIGRTKAYEMMAAGELPVVRLGRCVRVTRRRLAAWIAARIECGGMRGIA